MITRLRSVWLVEGHTTSGFSKRLEASRSAAESFLLRPFLPNESYRSAMPQDIEEYDASYAPAQWYLGIKGQNITAYDPSSGGYYQAVQVTYRYSGTPGEMYLDTGDIITRVDGNRVNNMNELRAAIGFSSGVVVLRVRDIRTGQFVNVNGIQLISPPTPGGGGGGPGGGP